MSSTGRESRSDARAHPCAISPASTPRSSASYVISLRSGNHAATQRTRAIHWSTDSSHDAGFSSPLATRAASSSCAAAFASRPRSGRTTCANTMPSNTRSSNSAGAPSASLKRTSVTVDTRSGMACSTHSASSGVTMPSDWCTWSPRPPSRTSSASTKPAPRCTLVGSMLTLRRPGMATCGRCASIRQPTWSPKPASSARETHANESPSNAGFAPTSAPTPRPAPTAAAPAPSPSSPPCAARMSSRAAAATSRHAPSEASTPS